MNDPRDYKLDLSDAAAEEKAVPVNRQFLSVLFACCSVYQRVYKNADGTAYTGGCPRCGKRVKFAVGPGGTSERSFVVY